MGMGFVSHVTASHRSLSELCCVDLIAALCYREMHPETSLKKVDARGRGSHTPWIMQEATAPSHRVPRICARLNMSALTARRTRLVRNAD